MKTTSLIGIAGAHFVAAELCQRGYIATLTSRNTEGIDILASSTDGSKQVGIQVKTSSPSKETKWILSEKHEKISFPNLFYVFVKLKDSTEKPDFFVVPSCDVAESIKHRHKKWLNELGRNGKAHNENPVRNFVLTDNELSKKYQNNWESLGI